MWGGDVSGEGFEPKNTKAGGNSGGILMCDGKGKKEKGMENGKTLTKRK